MHDRDRTVRGRRRLDLVAALGAAALLTACQTAPLGPARAGQVTAARAAGPQGAGPALDETAPTVFVRVQDGAPPAREPVTQLPPVVVHPSEGPANPWGETVPLRSATSEYQRVGPYRQPEWTTQRRFATTRAYVLSPGQVEFESWWKGKFRDGSEPSHLFQEEIGVGLPHRFQIDLYANITHDDDDGTRYDGTQFEVRWALADWGCIFLNPTLYAEYKLNANDAPDAWEAKVLLSQDFGCIHTAANLFFEREISGSLAEEMGFSVAAARAVIDQRLSVGVELKVERVTEKDSRSDPEVEVLLGPSVQWRPWRRTHLDIVPLFGLTDDAPDLEMYVVFGVDLGRGGGTGRFAPTSVRSN